MRPACFSVRMENNNCTPDTNRCVFKKAFKNIDTEVLKIFQNIQPKPKNWTFL